MPDKPPDRLGGWRHRVFATADGYLECMATVKNLLSWLKRCLWRFTGMDPDNLQSCLNWRVCLFLIN